MATSSRQSSLFGINDWKRMYQSFREADFQSYDYETLRKSFIDYLTQYYPETFNDWTESSEYVALLDVMAFMGQALAFRNDLNARENFIDTAERRDSVIKLANLVSYTPKRNIAAQGLLKIMSVATTESVFDINGSNLSNATILWNDPANSIWQDQFNAIINATLVNSQRIGRPGNTQSILNVKTDEYTMSVPSDQLPVISFTSQVDNTNMVFELVNVTSANSDNLYELPPASTGQFNMLYRNDKLGYGSSNTGFFFYFKQGTLKTTEFNFNEQIQNNFENINIQNINDTDTWLFQLNSSGDISSLWTKTDNLYIRNNLQGNNIQKIFAVQSRVNDQVTYLFGDGVFGEIPIGNFRAYTRNGNGLTYTISPSEMAGITINIPYVSRTNRVETLTVSLSLQTSVNNALQRESLAQIKERAPARYYTQNRMVNGEDYTNFPFTMFNSIAKSKAVNRTSIGISRNQDLIDPTGKYSSINVIGDDGALYADNQTMNTSFSVQNLNIAVEFLSQTLPVYLSSPEVIQYYQQFFSRISGLYTGTGSADGKVYWKRVTTESGYTTGYFYITDSIGNETPVPLGSYSSTNLMYVSEGSLIKFNAPSGKYFDADNHLQTGTPSVANGGRSYIWISMQSIIGDGYNLGEGTLSNGKGPVTTSQYIPTTAFIDITTGVYNPVTKSGATGIIPSFDNTLSSTLVRDVLREISLKTPVLYLNFNNLETDPNLRWNYTTTSPSLPYIEMIRMEYNSVDDVYQVYIKNRTYYFGSVNEVKFLFDTEKKVYDPKSGKTIADFVNVFKTNPNPAYVAPPTSPILGIDYNLYITGQHVQSDGYPDDYAVKVSTIDINNNYSYSPDFFDVIVGTATSYVFFATSSQNGDLTVTTILPAGEVIYAYNTRSAIETIKYEYPANTVFYAPTEDKFYISTERVGTNPPILDISETTNFYVLTGKSGLNFQYRHNSNNTTRIDPSTTNIIDLYVVTQNYYTEYQNWLNDTTGTVPEPSRPTMDELQLLYGSLNSYKMMSDSVVYNSVVFKPLFGPKAETALQGTIKVVKSPTTTVSDSQIRSAILSALNSYFTLDKWDFGDTFYFSELSAYLHIQLAGLISSVVLVPKNPDQVFGDLYEVRCAPNEIFVNAATISDNIVVISALTPQNLQM